MKRSTISLSMVLVGAGIAAAGLSACANQAVVAEFPDMTQTPAAPEAVLTVEQKDATIEQMQAEAKRNAARAGL